MLQNISGNRNDSVCTLGVMVIDSIRDLHNINSLTNIDKHMRSIQTPAATLSWKHFEIMTELQVSENLCKDCIVLQRVITLSGTDGDIL